MRSALTMTLLLFVFQICIVLTTVHVKVSAVNDSPAVATELGAIRGFRQEILHAKIDTFLGIPFAKPPIGKRRFSRPEPIDAWTTTYEALRIPRSCPQVSIEFLGKWANDVFSLHTQEGNIMENCLSLNIWAPQNANNLPVMVWFYGGGFSSGSINLPLYDGRYLSAFGNVIVVSVNYRVGLFGFLYLGSEDAPGNQGLLDQHLGIKWVYDHIEKFGGDKERITIFGESAGGVSTHLHTISSLPKYFKRAIIQSATPVYGFSFATPEKAFKTSISMVQTLGCPNEEFPTVLCCLKKLNHTTISRSLLYGPFLPTLDGLFFTKEPIASYSGVHDTQFLVGTNKNEGSFFLNSFQGMLQDGTPLFDKPVIGDEEVEQVIGMWTGIKDEEDRKKVVNFYSGFKSGNFDMLDAIVGDAVFTCGVRDIANNFTSSDSNNVYLYQLGQTTSAWPFPDWAGVQHAADLDLVFGHPLSGINLYKDADKELSKMVMTYWTNFAKTGNPNLDDKGKAAGFPEWPEYTLSTKQYMSLQTDARAHSNLHEERCEFWDGLGSRQPDVGDFVEDEKKKLEERGEL